eukprot:1185563-Prorocentrum_minimum.AAC.1
MGCVTPQSLVDMDEVGMAAVFDGHGVNGRRVAQFMKTLVPGSIYNKTIECSSFIEACAQVTKGDQGDQGE